MVLGSLIAGEHNECKEGNNATLIRGFYCDILH